MKKPCVVLISVLSLLLFPIWAQAGDCKYSKRINLELDLSSSDSLTVLAGAGSLSISGEPGAREADIRGTVCVSNEEWLDESRVEIRSGGSAKIAVKLPRTDSSWSLTGKRYATLDLELSVPENVRMDVTDSSGSIEIENVGEIYVKDSSGSLKIRDVKGAVSIEDSSGSIKLADIEGDVTIVSDSSGSINGHDINGSVLVKDDSSGGIHFKDVSGDFVVENDSSGEIVAERIGGDFRVLEDGSGGIRSSDVKGEVSVPRD